MTNKQFIENDLRNGDFVDYEVKAILKALKGKKNEYFAEKEYSGYTAVEEFYETVLSKIK